MATITFYNNFKKKVMDGTNIDLDTNTIKLALCDSGYTPDIDTHDFFDDITNEIVDADYTAGGKTVSGITLTVLTTSNVARIDASSPTWASLTFTNLRYAILYKATGVAGTSPLIAYVDFLANQNGTDATFTVTWSSSGIGNLA